MVFSPWAGVVPALCGAALSLSTSLRHCEFKSAPTPLDGGF